MVNQTETGTAGASEIGVMIVANPGTQSQVVEDGELILCVHGPDLGTARLCDEYVAQSSVVSLVLPQVVDDFRTQGDLMLLEQGSAQLHFAVGPASAERIGVQSARPIRQAGGIGYR